LAYDLSWRFPRRWFQVGKLDSVELTGETAAFKFQLRLGHRPPSAIRSLAMLDDYFAPDKPIVLAIAKFTTDGSYRPDGTWEPSKFKHATGDAYEAQMKAFNLTDGYLLCHLERKFSY
jgi:hypothetical protein